MDPETPRAHGFRSIELPERDLREINSMLDWRAGTLLNGRLLGRLGVTPGKRTEPGPVPDPRIVALHRLIDLTGKSVLEVGCFEGIHTLGLRMFSDDVTAIDIRPVNVIKTVARLSFHGTWAKVFPADVETLGPSSGVFDLIFHCGVLYHLMAPIEHLMAVGRMCGYLFLDTHVARDEKRIVTLEVDGHPYRGAFHDEGGWADPFSGKDRRSLWLTRESLEEALRRAGFADLKVLDEREERNGPRLSLWAARATAGPMKAE